MKIRDAKKQASRARVVEAARNLFEEIGFEILSREIKTEEGVAGASFLWVLARKRS